MFGTVALPLLRVTRSETVQDYQLMKFNINFANFRYILPNCVVSSIYTVVCGTDKHERWGFETPIMLFVV